MLTRKGTATWRGDGPTGKGTLDTQSEALHDQPYSAQMRFGSEDGKAGTNPEELIAAAHAGCYTMALSFGLTGAGHPPTELQTSAAVAIEKGEAGWSFKSIALVVNGKVPGITDEKFQELALAAKKGCPVSKALAAVEITLKAQLVS